MGFEATLTLYDSDDNESGEAGDSLMVSGEIEEHTDDSKTPNPMTWAKCPTTNIFEVRGPHYVDKNHELYKVKVPSDFSMYVPIAVDMFKTSSKDKEVYKKFRKPNGFQPDKPVEYQTTFVSLKYSLIINLNVVKSG